MAGSTGGINAAASNYVTPTGVAGKPQMPYRDQGFNPTQYDADKSKYDADMLAYNNGTYNGGGNTTNVGTQQDMSQMIREGGGNVTAAAGGVLPSGMRGMRDMQQPMQQQQGFDVNQAAAQGIQQAQQGASSEMGYRPMAIGAPSQANLRQYTNPYESQVVQQSLSDLERSRLMTQNTGDAQAGAANAFGGSRHGIAAAETNRGFADQAARTASGLRMGGYQNAQDMSRQASMANQQAGLQGSQQRLNAGSQLGNLSNLGFGMGQTIQGNMDRQGMQQQAMNQQLINAAKGQYAGYTGAPANSLQYLLQAVGAAPPVGSQTSGYNAGLFDYLSLGAGMFRGGN